METNSKREHTGYRTEPFVCFSGFMSHYVVSDSNIGRNSQQRPEIMPAMWSVTKQIVWNDSSSIILYSCILNSPTE